MIFLHRNVQHCQTKEPPHDFDWWVKEMQVNITYLSLFIVTSKVSGQ